MAKTGEQQQRVASNSHATTSFAYCALPLRIPERLNTLAHIYVKPFRLADTPAPGEEVAINGQTLFFTGLPLGMDQDSTRTLFQQFGNVTHVVLHHNKPSGVVVFDDVRACKAVLSAARNAKECKVSLEGKGGARGLRALVQAHKDVYRPKGGNQALIKDLNQRILSIEAEAAQRQEAALKAQADDGWTVVVRGKRRNKGEAGLAVRGAGVSKDAAAKVAAAKKAVSGIDDFYRFQRKEKARNALLELRRKFEEDKQRIQLVKAQRKFKPM